MGSCYSTLCRGSNDQNNKTNSGRNSDSKLRKGAAADDRVLCQVPGRLIGNGASNLACLYTQQGKKGTNQDAMIVWENFSSRSDTVFCGVFDGHGPYGHMVARKVRDNLPVLLSTQWNEILSNNQNGVAENGNAAGSCVAENGNAAGGTHPDEFMDDGWCEQLEVEENGKLPEMYLPLKQSMLKAFKLMDKELKLHQAIDCFCSGTTTVALVKQGQDLIIGNVGDSRAVLATRDKDNSLTAVQLTVDLKPNLPREAARIQQCKGRVFALQDEPEVSRVWLPNSDSPGLAMARAFGDFCLKDFGLISVPDIYYRRITERDEFIILATDGVWDVISNKEAVDIVASAPGRATAARALIDCATRAWRLKYPTSKNDDCAVVCLFLEHVSTAHVAQDQKDLTEHVSTADVAQDQKDLTKAPEEEVISVTVDEIKTSNTGGVSPSHSSVLEHSSTLKDSDEIVPVIESTEEKLPEKSVGQSKRSLAECISTSEEEEWSALEGITRVNSLLSIPRFLSNDKGSASWRRVMMKQ